MASDKITAPKIIQMRKDGQRIVCLTAYDYPTALIAEEAGVDLVLVGDSMGNTLQGHKNTLSVTLDQVCYHTEMVRRGLNRALLVADLPFGSYNVSREQAIASAIKLVQAGADAVKLEGTYLSEIEGIIKAGVPVMGHLGFTPQSLNNFGGHKVQGRGDHGADIIEAALALEQAGVFAMVLELIPSVLSAQVTSKISVPTIGIGAGLETSGEIQVWFDVIGLAERKLKHAKWYMDGRTQMLKATAEYVAEVRAGKFPSEENSF
ncbi:MAG TPA: 3-methyl-2-oxobutanoate hydroxymethyltransferase [Fimbriimonas sp.]|nr:3-methyl-2-oxobutanoate hydroxymethyltransferase [Fimbriimonas sp.]